MGGTKPNSREPAAETKSAAKQLSEYASYFAVVVAFVKGLKDLSSALTIDDFLYRLGNTAAAIFAVAFLALVIAFWLTAFGLGDLVDRIPVPFVGILCGLAGIYWAFQEGGYALERSWGKGIGVIVVVVTTYFLYRRVISARQSRN